VEIAIKRSLSDGSVDPAPSSPMQVEPENSFRETGKFVGLKNLANTCSFNSLLQTYFMLPGFRMEILKFRAKKVTSAKQIRSINCTSLFEILNDFFKLSKSSRNYLQKWNFQRELQSILLE
jgi:uncharacterized UBP type Zn finger protein